MSMLRTPEHEHRRLVEMASDRGWKRPPRRPEPKECCDTGCGLCIWDDYEIRIRRWRAEHDVPESPEVPGRNAELG